MATSAIQSETEAQEQTIDGSLDYGRLAVIAALPLSRFYPEGGEEFLHNMAGATIVRIGSTDQDGIEGGGLIIDYRPVDSNANRRVVFAFNESGLWMEWAGVPDPASRA